MKLKNCRTCNGCKAVENSVSAGCYLGFKCEVTKTLMGSKLEQRPLETCLKSTTEDQFHQASGVIIEQLKSKIIKQSC